MPYFFALFITSKYFVLLYKYVFCVFTFYQLCLLVDGFRVESYQLIVIHSNRQPSQCVQKPSNMSLHFYSFEWQLSYSILNSSLVTMIRMADIGSLCKKSAGLQNLRISNSCLSFRNIQPFFYYHMINSCLFFVKKFNT